MGRPPLPIGTYGTINVTELGPKLFEARARFRMRNGRIRPIKRRGTSESAATRNLKKALAELADEVAGKKINGDTRFGHVLDLWLADFKAKVDRGVRAPKSFYDYRDTADNHLRPRMGALTCREAENAGLCDENLKDIRDKVGYAAAQRAKTVLSHACKYAMRHGAMKVNPARSVESLDRDDTEPILALEPEQRQDFMTKLRAWVTEYVEDPKRRLGVRARAWMDLPDVVEAMLATGERIGEVLAMVGDGVDPAKRKVVADHHLIRVEGEGIVRVPKRKGRRSGLVLSVPTWSVPLWRRRKLESGGGPLFPAWNGAWEDPSNVGKRIGKVCKAIGYGWVSSRILRHTVGSHLGDSNLSNEQIADQLGNTPEIIQRNYRRPKVANEAIAHHLETLMDPAGEAR